MGRSGCCLHQRAGLEDRMGLLQQGPGAFKDHPDGDALAPFLGLLIGPKLVFRVVARLFFHLVDPVPGTIDRC